MKEFLEALSNKIRSPIFGYFVLAFLVFNWKQLLLLWLGDSDIETRIDFFCFSTNIFSLLFYPLLASTIGAIIYPWINVFFLRMVHIPAIYKNNLQLQTDHKRLLEQTRLESQRNALFAKKEEGLIEQAKRDQEIQSINDKEVRKKLEKEIDSLRQEKSDLENTAPNSKTTTQDSVKKSKQEQFQEYFYSGKLDDFIANRDEILSQNSYLPKNIPGSPAAKAFGLIEIVGSGSVKVSEKGREFFEWYLLNENRLY